MGLAGMTLHVRCRTRRRQYRCRVPRGRRREHCRPTHHDTESPPVRFRAFIISFAVSPLLAAASNNPAFVPCLFGLLLVISSNQLAELAGGGCRLHEQAGDIGSALQGPVSLPRCRAAGPPACTRCIRLGDTPHPPSPHLSLALLASVTRLAYPCSSCLIVVGLLSMVLSLIWLIIALLL